MNMIIGHKKQRDFLNKMVLSGEVPHALLFSGPEQVGKKKVALDLISSVFKESMANHPDFTMVVPESKQIQIGQIRDVNWKLSLKPVKAPVLGVVIDQAHLMTRHAQNCFLKTLEEPKTNALLILVTEHPDFLLPTIVSRCQAVKFYPVPGEEIRKSLKNSAPQKDLDEIVGVSMGRPGLAVEFSECADKLKKRRETIKELDNIVSSPVSKRFDCAKELSERDDLRGVLAVWLYYFREKLLSGSGALSAVRLKNILDSIQETMHLLSTTNVNSRLALEILMMEF